MIARIWRGITLSTNADKYHEYLNQIVIPSTEIADGNEGLLVMKEARGELTHFLLLSLWVSRAALEAFADPQLDSGVSREERGFLLAFESTAAVYEVM